MKISENKFVSLIYDLTVEEDGEQELVEHVTKEYPLSFMYGMGMMLDAFEKNIEGLRTGDKFSFSLLPEEAYGEYIEENVVELPKKVFEINGKFDEERIAEGETLPMTDAHGNRMMGSVLEIKPDAVVMDFNHPLAGEMLHFKGEVIDVHEATVEEIAALTQPHGKCDCSSCDSAENKDGCGCN
jgi:FKBP-type peptidyl-prolyl cis-trans isomerase SlyD